uniref:Uncharacterized protein MANES_02G200900 n=1 Tax=Rhizophora mucronata TaxID=61149 RepID=A0A2P2QMX7_RHIMU
MSARTYIACQRWLIHCPSSYVLLIRFYDKKLISCLNSRSRSLQRINT